ncbi:MAG: chromate efflux transporter [Deltaproteobacteria bacterium]|nr:chromate efflux transporter [Deltaproteobacteria bacterium]
MNNTGGPNEQSAHPTNPVSKRLVEVTALFLKLGLTAFGGPAAHIAIMHTEVVKRRRWVDDREFLDLLGVTNLIPGPNSTEMAIHIGYLRAGYPGLILGGICFMLPAVLITMALAWVYVSYGATPEAGWLLYGVKPVIIVVILQALWGLGKKAVKGPLTAAVGLIVIAGGFIDINQLLLLVSGGLIVMLLENRQRLKDRGLYALLVPVLPVSGAAYTIPFSSAMLFLKFLKIGSVLYGSGYVLLAFLHADFVTGLGWLTDRQLIDAVAVGQLTPGPVFTTATFIGYILGGATGSVIATVGIFLPSFIIVAIISRFVPRLRNSPWAAGLLDGVNVASLGLMATVTWYIGKATFVDPLTVIIAVISAVLLLRFRINTTWIIFGGAAAGFIKGMFF